MAQRVAIVAGASGVVSSRLSQELVQSAMACDRLRTSAPAQRNRIAGVDYVAVDLANPADCWQFADSDAVEAAGHLDLLGWLLGFWLLRQRHGEDALLERCLDLVSIGTIRKFKAAFERAEGMIGFFGCRRVTVSAAACRS